jgi:hypothetical protein
LFESILQSQDLGQIKLRVYTRDQKAYWIARYFFENKNLEVTRFIGYQKEKKVFTTP